MTPPLPLPRAAGRVAALTAALLLLPAVARLYTTEVNWGPGDFVAAAALLFGAGMALLLVFFEALRKCFLVHCQAAFLCHFHGHFNREAECIV